MPLVNTFAPVLSAQKLKPIRLAMKKIVFNTEQDCNDIHMDNIIMKKFSLVLAIITCLFFIATIALLFLRISAIEI